MTLILGIEGTAWAASAAVFDADREELFVESDVYRPESGGIHPREAAEHMREAIPAVVETALDHARETYGQDTLDAVAFSRGPGLGPCLRMVGTAARAIAGSLDVDLVGVNHMVAHLEIGRHRSGFESPVCLNASGANAHVLGFHNGRYRVLGETMDTGVGNALDKFTRHVGWTHPGGPKVEEHATEGEYVEFPYVVKGMDFSFSGIVSAAKAAVDDDVPVADVCCGLQETVFGMLTEVSERALSLTGSEELVLGGGVGQNDRLREMLSGMCEQRGADFYAPEGRFLRDNAGMIAVLGAKMYDAGDTIPIEESRVRPEFRPDEVDVTWRASESGGEGAGAGTGDEAGDGTGDEAGDGTGDEAGAGTGAGDGGGANAGPGPGDEVHGAEALVTVGEERVLKERRPRAYRHPDLDDRLRRERTRSEARLTSEARRHGVPTPVIYDVDPSEGRLVFEHVGETELRGTLSAARVRDVGAHLATLHAAGAVHGDPTTRNVRLGDGRTYLIDFGLGYYTDDVEDHAMDLHVFSQSLAGTADDADRLQEAFEDAYRATGTGHVVEQLREIEGRGRYQSASSPD